MDVRASIAALIAAFIAETAPSRSRLAIVFEGGGSSFRLRFIKYFEVSTSLLVHVQHHVHLPSPQDAARTCSLVSGRAPAMWLRLSSGSVHCKRRPVDMPVENFCTGNKLRLF
jgi:hypothetical protein